MVHQELSLVPELSVAENILLGRLPAGPNRWSVDRPRMERQAAEVLRTLDAVISPNQRIRDLSIAKRRLVEIAKGISTQARVLILDQPTHR